MIIDFSDLSKIVEREILTQWDHQFLNDLLPFPTTAENLAHECFTRLEKTGLPIDKIKLWETAKAFVEIIQ